MHVHITHSTLADRTDETVTVRPMQASIDGADIPIAGYAVEETTEGPALSLILCPTSLTISDQQVKSSEQAEPTAPVRVWGSPGRDPREGIAGWAPASTNNVTASLAAQQVTP